MSDVNGLTIDRERDLRAIEEGIQRINKMVAEDLAETAKRRHRINGWMDDWEAARMQAEYEEAMHIVRTYEMRRERHYLEGFLQPFNIVPASSGG